MATKMLDVSISFIGRFIQWVDDTQSVLVAGGNQTSDVWWILTRVMRAIFEDYFAPARLVLSCGELSRLMLRRFLSTNEGLRIILLSWVPMLNGWLDIQGGERQGKR